MYETLGDITLKTGEIVTAGVIKGPDVVWAERLEKLLQHKGDPWNWQNSAVLRADIGLEAYFYILHRAGQPLANIMTIELSGVGIFGHVWTRPDDRQKGACARLMERQMAHFRDRGGLALFLDTEFDSVPYHIYERFGFRGIEDKSGVMDYYATSKANFEATYFAHGEVAIQPLSWLHWPASPALFAGDFPGVVRCAPLGIVERETPESPLLSLLHAAYRDRKTGEAARAMVLQHQVTTAVVGLAVWGWHAIWPDLCVVDIYCHPNYWAQGEILLASLALPEAERYLAYGDTGCPEKQDVLTAAGFKKTTTLRQWVAGNRAKTNFLDVVMFEK